MMQSYLSDNSGRVGAPRTINVDVCALGRFHSGNLLTIDASTSVSAGPTAVPVAPSPRVTVTLNGYVVAFVTLQ